MNLQGILPSTGQLSPVAVVTASGIAGMTCWTVSIPADTIKSRYQASTQGMCYVFAKLVKEEVIGALFLPVGLYGLKEKVRNGVV